MADRAHIVSACDRYVRHVSDQDTDAILDLFADDCWIEDPIGTEKKVGKDALREFYDGIKALPVTPVMTREGMGPVCIAGNEAAFQFRIDIDLGETKIAMTSTDAMVFDDAGRIVSMRAYADGEASPDA
jgi:steroid delta-isomerase